MVVHCVLSLPVGDELVGGENSAEDQDVDDLLTAEHHRGKYLVYCAKFWRVIATKPTVMLSLANNVLEFTLFY